MIQRLARKGQPFVRFMELLEWRWLLYNVHGTTDKTR